jgi:hypothetical protein
MTETNLQVNDAKSERSAPPLTRRELLKAIFSLFAVKAVGLLSLSALLAACRGEKYSQPPVHPTREAQSARPTARPLSQEATFQWPAFELIGPDNPDEQKRILRREFNTNSQPGGLDEAIDNGLECEIYVFMIDNQPMYLVMAVADCFGSEPPCRFDVRGFIQAAQLIHAIGRGHNLGHQVVDMNKAAGTLGANAVADAFKQEVHVQMGAVNQKTRMLVTDQATYNEHQVAMEMAVECEAIRACTLLNENRRRARVVSNSSLGVLNQRILTELGQVLLHMVAVDGSKLDNERFYYAQESINNTLSRVLIDILYYIGKEPTLEYLREFLKVHSTFESPDNKMVSLSPVQFSDALLEFLLENRLSIPMFDYRFNNLGDLMRKLMTVFMGTSEDSLS